MRVTKSQIVRGVGDYVRGEILPKMGNNKAVQIIMTVAVNAALANNKTVDAVLENSFIKALMKDDGTGTYDVAAITDAIKPAIDQFGCFPVKIPAIPFLSPEEITLSLSAQDVDAIRQQIENSV